MIHPRPPSPLRLFLPGRGELVARRQGRRAPKASAGREFPAAPPPCIRRMMRAWRAPRRAPLQGFSHVLSERMARPPGPGGDARLMFLARRSCLRAGHGLEFDSPCAYLAQRGARDIFLLTTLEVKSTSLVIACLCSQIRLTTRYLPFWRKLCEGASGR